MMDKDSSVSKVKWQSIARVYALALVAGIVLSLLYSYSLPTVYTAEKVVADEYTEMDIAIGTSHFKEWIREQSGLDEGINSVEVYAQILTSREFAREMGKVLIPRYKTSYNEYVKSHHRLPWWHMGGFEDDEEVTDRILECIRHRVVAKNRKLTIQVVDPDPVVSAQMVDTVCTHLQAAIGKKRQKVSRQRFKNLAVIMDGAKARYDQLLKLSSQFKEAHQNDLRAEERSRYESLRRKTQIAYNTFRTVEQQYLREKMLAERSHLSFGTLKDATVPLTPSNPQYIVNMLSFTFVVVLLTTFFLLYRHVDNRRRPLQYGNIFSPWHVTIGIWTALIGMYYLLPNDLYPLKEQFFICLVLWVVIFCLSSFATYNLLPRQHENSRHRLVVNPFNTTVFNLLFCISVSITPLYLYSILKIVSMFGSEDFIANIRLLAVHGNQSFGLLSLSYVLNQALLIMALWRYPRIPLWVLITVYVMTFMNAFAIMEKGMLFFIVIVTLFVTYEKRLLKARSLMLSLATIVVLFFIINLFRSTDESYTENETLLDFFAMYVLSPPVAFGTLSPDISLLPGSHTFQAVYKLLNSKGLGNFAIETDRVQEFVFVPIPTNIYTVFQPFFEDFKYQGISFFALVYGTFSGWMYRLYQNGSAVGKSLYTYLVFLLVLQFYQENLILNIMQFSHLVFLVMIVQQRFVGFDYNCKRA